LTILCCGDREWRDEERIRHVLRELLPAGSTVIHGAARGADTIAGSLAKGQGHTVIPCPADWDLYGKTAGPVRNRAMLHAHPDVELVLAFHDRIFESRGTRDMIDVALSLRIVVYLYTRSDRTILLPRARN
jgi:SLOG family YspA-like protein